MIGSASWQVIATVIRMPVSGTHAIVGALLGFAYMSDANTTIKWNTLLRIAISWIASPFISGFIAATMYIFVRKLILLHHEQKSHQRAMVSLPILYALTVGLNALSILLHLPLLGRIL